MYLILFIFGSVIFSFINVMVLRMERGEDFIRGRSRCDSCKHELSFLDTFPLMGYVLLKGRCRYCGSRISVRNPLAELLGGCLLFFLYCRKEHYVLYFLFCTVLSAIALYDLDTMEIPDVYQLMLFVIGMLISFSEGSNVSRLLGAAVFSVPLIVIYLVNRGIGEGDIILAAIVGFTLDYNDTVTAMTVCYLTAGAAGTVMILSKRKGMKDEVPLAPFIALGCMTVLGVF